MRITRIALLTGAAAIILAGYAGMAEARTPQPHVLTVRLPDGPVEQVRYTGDVPPVVIVAPETAPVSFDPGFPFRGLEQIEAAMDQQFSVMFRNINAMMAQTAEGFGTIPAMAGPGVCMRSVQITYTGNGQAPHVWSQTAGDCGVGHGGVTPVVRPNEPVPHQTPRIIEAKTAPPYAGLLRTVSDLHR